MKTLPLLIAIVILSCQLDYVEENLQQARLIDAMEISSQTLEVEIDDDGHILDTISITITKENKQGHEVYRGFQYFDEFGSSQSESYFLAGLSEPFYVRSGSNEDRDVFHVHFAMNAEGKMTAGAFLREIDSSKDSIVATCDFEYEYHPNETIAKQLNITEFNQEKVYNSSHFDTDGNLLAEYMYGEADTISHNAYYYKADQLDQMVEYAYFGQDQKTIWQYDDQEEPVSVRVYLDEGGEWKLVEETKYTNSAEGKALFSEYIDYQTGLSWKTMYIYL